MGILQSFYDIPMISFSVLYSFVKTRLGRLRFLVVSNRIVHCLSSIYDSLDVTETKEFSSLLLTVTSTALP
jgi:hypothetical protein